ncbi:hypothetical protein HY990_00715 [Candidatus Micrarchaeota archaeon]|nr:hypothetical protein [Candidatus Micrarchaeota archaeon]
MGFLDSLMGGDDGPVIKSSAKSSFPLDVSLSFTPLRLCARRASSVELIVRIKNTSGESQLVSFDVSSPRGVMMGFDSACISKTIEKRVGEVKPGMAVEIPVSVWSNNQTKDGSYSLDVSFYCHYLDYDKVILQMRKSTSIRAV